MKLTIISGSQRAQSQSLNVVNYLDKIAKTHFGKSQVFDLHELNFPL